MDLNRLTDEELMVMYQNGNEKAFQVIYTRHSGRILSYIRSKVSNQELAGDLFQETFIKIHKSKNLYNNSFQVLPWVFTITRNTVIDGLRKHKSQSVAELDLDQVAAPVVEEAVGMAELSPVLSKLPDNQRQAIQMRYIEEKTFEEIAERLETSSENVRQMISRGVKGLKKIFGREGA